MNQILLVLGAIIILGISSKSVSQFWLAEQEIQYRTEADITGNLVAQSILEEIAVKRFDQKTTPAATTTDSTTFTSPDSLGLDTGELSTNLATFNDIDDYNRYTRSVSTPRIGTFAASCKVYYVTLANTDAVSAVKQFFKRVDVTVKNSYISSNDSAITVSRVFGYRYN